MYTFLKLFAAVASLGLCSSHSGFERRELFFLAASSALAALPVGKVVNLLLLEVLLTDKEQCFL